MTVVGVIFIAIGLVLSILLAARLKSSIYVPLFFVHLAASFFYWQYSLYSVSDTASYYTFSAADSDFSAGTWVVGRLTAFLRDLLHASYLDMFMVFHLFGYAGISMLYHICRERWWSNGPPSRAFNVLIHGALFVPGLHMWTSAIGKDSLMFLAIICFTWGVYNPRRRFWSAAMGFLACALIRPHVAALLGGSAALAVAMSRRIPVTWRMLIFATVGVGFIGGLPFLQDFLGLQSTDAESVAVYIEQRQRYNLEGGSSVDISQYSFPMQFFTYMYRPLFLDANGTMALIVSVENLFYLILTILAAPSIARELWVGADAFETRFNFLFWSLSTSLFATTTSNLGIAVRQKTALVPSLLLMVFAGIAYRSQQHSQRAASADHRSAAATG